MAHRKRGPAALEALSARKRTPAATTRRACRVEADAQSGKATYRLRPCRNTVDVAMMCVCPSRRATCREDAVGGSEQPCGVRLAPHHDGDSFVLSSGGAGGGTAGGSRVARLGAAMHHRARCAAPEWWRALGGGGVRTGAGCGRLLQHDPDDVATTEGA